MPFHARPCNLQSLLMMQLQGSPAVEAANDRFSATMTNVVRWSDAAAAAAGVQRKQLRSDTAIQVHRWSIQDFSLQALLCFFLLDFLLCKQ